MTRQVSIFFSSFFLLVLPLTSSLPSFSYILDPEKSISASLITFCIDSFFLFSSSLSLVYRGCLLLLFSLVHQFHSTSHKGRRQRKKGRRSREKRNWEICWTLLPRQADERTGRQAGRFLASFISVPNHIRYTFWPMSSLRCVCIPVSPAEAEANWGMVDPQYAQLDQQAATASEELSHENPTFSLCRCSSTTYTIIVLAFPAILSAKVAHSTPLDTTMNQPQEQDDLISDLCAFSCSFFRQTTFNKQLKDIKTDPFIVVF